MTWTMNLGQALQLVLMTQPFLLASPPTNLFRLCLFGAMPSLPPMGQGWKEVLDTIGDGAYERGEDVVLIYLPSGVRV